MPQPVHRFCFKCGTPLPAGAVFCPACGSPLPAAAAGQAVGPPPGSCPPPPPPQAPFVPQPRSPAAPPKKSSGGCLVAVIVGVLLLLLIGGGVLVGIYLAWAEEQSEQKNTPQASQPDPYDGYAPDVMTFPDERQAMDAHVKDPSRVNLERVAAVRYRHAVELFDYARRAGAREPALAALAYAESAVNISPEDADRQFFYARILLFTAGEAPYPVLLAEDALAQAVRIRSDFPAARLLLGRLLADQQRHFAALGHFEAVLTRHPELASVPLLDTMTRCYLDDGLESRGIKHLTEFLPRRDSVKPFTHLALARLARAVADPAAAAHLAEAERLGDAAVRLQVQACRTEWGQ